MRKVKLELESLAVESFSASPAENAGHAGMSADCSVVCTFDWDCTA
jgi:hypothetical protein